MMVPKCGGYLVKSPICHP